MADKIDWQEAMSVGNPLIDDQHRQLINIYNWLVELEQESVSAVDQLFVQLLNYASEHFACEEECFHHADHPLFDAHKQEHDDFLDKVLHLQQEWESSKTLILHEVKSFLREWLLEHICISDKNLFDRMEE